MTVNRLQDSTRRAGATCRMAVLGAVAAVVAAYAVAQTAQADTGRHESDVVVAPDTCTVYNATVYGPDSEGLAAALDVAQFGGEHQYVVGLSLKWTRRLSLWRLQQRSPVTLHYWDCKHRLLEQEDQIVTLSKEFVHKKVDRDADILFIEVPEEARSVQIDIGGLLFTPRVAIPMPKPRHGK